MGLLEAVAQPREQSSSEHQGSPQHVERGGAYLMVSEHRSRGPRDGGAGANAAIGVVQQLLANPLRRQAKQRDYLLVSSLTSALAPASPEPARPHPDAEPTLQARRPYALQGPRRKDRFP